MRTNIDIDDALMDQALQAGPFKTKKDAVEAGLKLLARQAAYREVAKWRGKLKWEGDDSIDWVAANQASGVEEPSMVQETQPTFGQTKAKTVAAPDPARKAEAAQKATRARR